MSWVQLKVNIPRCNAEQFADKLSDSGALSVTLTDAADTPVYEPMPGTQPLWPSTTIVGLFANDDEAQIALKILTAEVAALEGGRVVMEHLEERDWVGESQKDFPVLNFGNLWVVPEGQRPPDPDAVVVVLQPGIAFGTGTHPTTALCLKWLSGGHSAGKLVLDFGCGSGILAIAAVKMGAVEVMCVDHDLQAVESTRQNAVNNNIAERIGVSSSSQDLIGPYDLIMANILLNPLVELAPRFDELLAKQGTLVLSGITEDQLPVLRQTYAERFNVVRIDAQDEWLCVVVKRAA